MLNRIPGHVRYVLKAMISSLLLGFVIWKYSLWEAASLLLAIEAEAVAVALFLVLAGILLSAWKWGLLLNATGTPAPFARTLRLFWIGAFFSNFLPGRTGGDLVRAYGIAHESRQRVAAALSVVFDRTFNLSALVAIGLIALTANLGSFPQVRLADSAAWVWGCVAAAGLSCLGILAFRSRLRYHRRVTAVLEAAAAAGRSLWRRPLSLLAVNALAVVYQSISIIYNYVIARGLGLDVQLGIFFCLIPAIALVTMLPITLNGLGLREGAYILAFTQAGVTAEEAAVIAVAATLGTIGVSLFGGLLYATSPARMPALWPRSSTPPEPGGVVENHPSDIPADLCSDRHHVEADRASRRRRRETKRLNNTEEAA